MFTLGRRRRDATVRAAAGGLATHQSKDYLREKVFPRQSIADQFREDLIIPFLSANAPCGDRWVDAMPPSERQDLSFGWRPAHIRIPPRIGGNQTFSRPTVRISLKSVQTALVEVIEERFRLPSIEVKRHMGQFVAEGEPEVVQAVITQG